MKHSNMLILTTIVLIAPHLPTWAGLTWAAVTFCFAVHNHMQGH